MIQGVCGGRSVIISQSMRLSNLGRGMPVPSGSGVRRVSPNNVGQRGNNPNLSVHSDHLWNMMEDVELFPQEIYQLLRNEERNLGCYKKALEREKHRVGESIDNLKKEFDHNIDDLKISIFAQLDRIYRLYMEKYATLKGEIMQVKRLKEEIQLNIESRGSPGFVTKYSSGRGDQGQRFATNNNASIMKSMEKNNLEVKKYQMLNYISELQREKIMPLHQLTSDLVILTQYQNGYYQHKEFQLILAGLVDSLKANLRTIYDKKYQFIREPEQICQTQDRPILEELVNQLPGYGGGGQNNFAGSGQNNFLNNPSSFGGNQNNLGGANQSNLNPYTPTSNIRQVVNPPTNGAQQFRRITPPQVTKLQQTKFINIAPEQQNITFQWAEGVTLTPTQTIKSVADDIILCALQVGRNLMAVGSKDGVITVYDCQSGQKMANLRGHKSSICKLALVSNNGKKYLASGSDHGCSSIVLWDTTSWNMRMKIEYHKAAVTAILDLQDNRSLVSGSYDKTINVYNLNSEGKMLFNLPVNRTSVTAVLMSCNGSKLITCGLDDSVCVYQIMRGAGREVETMFLEREIQNNTMICSIVASLLHPELVFLGTKDGKIKLINIERGEAYKTYNVCNTAVIEMVIVERQTKPEYPLAVCWPCGEENLKIVNTESGRVTSQVTRGFIEFGCGIGPKSFFLSNGRSLAMLSQSKDRREVNLFRLETNS